MRFGRSGTAAHGRSGTGGSVDREPAAPATRGNPAPGRAANYANKESSRFLLTPPEPGTFGGAGQEPARIRRVEDEGPLTRVTLTWIEGAREDWLRFGTPQSGRIVDRRTRVECYAPGAVFALVRWASSTFGTTRSTLDIVRAVRPGDACSTLPLVEPGGELLLTARGWPAVRRALALIEAVEVAGFDPCAISPDYWCHAHNRLAARMQPRAYGPLRHRAWLQRGRLLP